MIRGLYGFRYELTWNSEDQACRRGVSRKTGEAVRRTSESLVVLRCYVERSTGAGELAGAVAQKSSGVIIRLSVL